VLAFSDWTRSRVLVRAGVRFDEHLSTRVFNASFDAYLANSASGPTRAFGDLLNIRQFLTGNGIFAFFDAPWTPIYIAVAFFLHPWLGFLALFFALVQTALAWFGHRKTVGPTEVAQKAQTDANVYVQSKLRNTEVIESMGMVENLRRRWRGWHDAAMARSADAHAVSERVAAVSKFIRYTQQSLSLAAGALLVIDGQLSPGGMIAANLLISRALSPIDQIVSTWRIAAGVKASFERLEALLRDYPERDPNLSRVAPEGAVELRNVTATAPGRAAPILDDVSFAVPAGSITAVLGPSGSGKSTLARVLVGIWPQVSGEVLLDGRPLDGWNRIELGTHLGYLPQDIELLEGTIAENIARFREVDSAKVIEAARMAGLHEMILRFPKGYDTSVGEAGRLLSGGQRQRIALARAIYDSPAVLVLDEPNANLDEVGEAALFRALQQLKGKGKTVFLITHRPGALSLADRLLLLQDGRVRAFGTPAEVAALVRPAPKEPPPPSLEAAQPA
jgi:ATP-binding cassette subfamily C exporter for protease/lipase